MDRSAISRAGRAFFVALLTVAAVAIGPAAHAREDMLRAIGVPSLDALIDQTIPPGIRAAAPLDLPEAETEYGYLRRLRTIAERNVVARSMQRAMRARVTHDHLNAPS